MNSKMRLLGFVGVLLGVCLLALPVAAQESTTGSIEGTVKDADGGALPGATVTITSAQGTKVQTTDETGRYRFPYLTPGTYMLRAEMYSFQPVEQTNIEVRLGARVRLDVTLNPGVEKTIEVTAQAPVVDLSSATTGASISQELMSSIPIGRDFASTLTLAPGVVSSGVGDSNPSIAGASGLENTYMVDGVTINNTGYGAAGSYSIVLGSLGTGVNFDYIQEVQVKTGGYEPEFGEALGGFVNLVTKSGGNAFKGSLFGYFSPGSFEAEREEITRTNATAQTLESDQWDIGGEGGGPLAKDKAFIYGAFNPQWTTATRRTALARREQVDWTLDRDRTIWNYAANAKFFPNPDHSLSVSAFGDPSKGDMGPQRSSAYVSSNPEDRFTEITYGGHNFTGKWTGSLTSNFFLEGSLAWHKDEFKEDLLNNAAGGSDRRVDPWISYGGVGYFGNSDGENLQLRLKGSNFLQAGGEHNFRYGIDWQDIKYNNTTNYSGTPGQLNPDGEPLTSGFSWYIHPGGTQFRVTRSRTGPITAETEAQYLAFHVADTWNVTPDLNLMGGFRYERNKLVGNLKDQVWGDNWGPRVHATWDPTKDNKTKVSFAWGRFYGKIPNDLAVRALSSEVQNYMIYALEDVDLSQIGTGGDPIFEGRDPLFFTQFGDEETEIDPDSKITFQDEYIVGFEREILPFFNLGANFMYRDLGRTLEDVALVPYSAVVNGTEDFGHYFITNPSPSVLTECPEGSCASGQPGFPDPAREYKALTFKADKRFHDNWQLLASYTWAELKGNYEGYFRRDNGQSDPFITSLFDFPYLADTDVWQNTLESGTLPNNRTHVFNVFGSYAFDMGLNIGLGFRAQSGVPITRLGWNEAYGNGGEIVLVERGFDGNSPSTAVFDLHADYPIRMGNGQQVSLAVDFFNLFNQQKAADLYMDFEDGGTIAPPPSLNIPACPECLDPDFGQALVFQAPFEMRFTVKYSWGN